MMTESMPRTAALPSVMTTSVAAAEDGAQYARELAQRRSQCQQWIYETFGGLEPAMDPRDGRRWALNHARLRVNKDLEQANEGSTHGAQTLHRPFGRNGGLACRHGSLPLTVE